ncbi:Laminin A family protein [Trichomonas vaginalis G3]|uniref:Phospholipase B-like n=1 Tax=Trichomonas vaginalis (strain ATCC PRA-98 / G3) TaxID=412133 RepID=A2EGL4_TRIV3|nr:phosphatidylinositol catabolic process [Trichomonas vaginalis G3]EAY08209.1 Laminin A family protein [Trichomonas vaginalis G3]KAI5519749.1 phosphatidylinositol catabolic process [Trichomonas vaginalis G3]|eukprot:XP_001320432.1 Laminin A family protein [Trichomonas vaginalis G3]
MLSLAVLVSSKNRTASCRMVDGAIQMKDGIESPYDAYAIYDDDLNTTGWHQIRVVGNENSEPKAMLRCAGAVEGYLAHKEIYQHFYSINEYMEWNTSATSDEERYPPGYAKFVAEHIKYIRQSIDAYPESEYWRMIGLINEQAKGVYEGYLQHPEHKYMSEIDHWCVQAEGDLGDFLKIINLKKIQGGNSGGPTRLSSAPDPKQLGDKCTGLVRLLDDYSDIYFAHDTWSNILALHGTLKEYHLPVKDFAAKTISLSTRPGQIASADDFYLTDSGLMILETTMGIFNDSLFYDITPKGVSTWMRSLLASRMAHNGSEWTQIFVKNNLGTYNNQYLIVDTNKFQRYKKPEKDLLWVIEQSPGTYSMARDITDKLVEKGFFPSFNKPHFPELSKLFMYPEKIAANPATASFWDYNTTARNLLIEREALRLNDFETFKKFMRYNNWQRDLYSNGDPGQMIMSRYDLRYGGLWGDKKPDAGLDTKAAKLTTARSLLTFDAINSPTYDQQPVFDFKAFPEFARIGLPDRWNFTWIKFDSMTYNRCNFTTEKECLKQDYCGWCTYSQQCMAGDEKSPFVSTCDDGWMVYKENPKWAVPVIITCSLIILVFIVVIYAMHFINKRKNA